MELAAFLTEVQTSVEPVVQNVCEAARQTPFGLTLFGDRALETRIR